MAIFKKPILRSLANKTREMPTGLWTKCPSCSEVIHNLALDDACIPEPLLGIPQVCEDGPMLHDMACLAPDKPYLVF